MPKERISVLVDDWKKLEFEIACRLLNTTMSDQLRIAVDGTIQQVRAMPDGNKILDAMLARLGEGESERTNRDS